MDELPNVVLNAFCTKERLFTENSLEKSINVFDCWLTEKNLPDGQVTTSCFPGLQILRH